MDPEHQRAIEVLSSISKETIEPLMNQMMILVNQIVESPQSLDWKQLAIFMVFNAIVSFFAIYAGAYLKKKLSIKLRLKISKK